MLKQYQKEIEKLLDQSLELCDDFNSPISFNSARQKVISKKLQDQNYTQKVISLNKNILYTNKKQLQDNYQDLQISRSLNDISRCRSQMQLVVSSVLPNVEIRHNSIQTMSQPQQVMRQLRKQNSKLRLQPTQSLATLSPLATQSFSNQSFSLATQIPEFQAK
ncbi:Hypothetical_protein [Hexamita inflata]|uniref:Hypothetical_protein n=1 Tax=Hexamita inflata TaxID=28002 RepID=A0AA86N9D8_9EUKA|nr:Hypothetical protein HINF_LOCUS3037 [Hexamita inflata]